MKIQKPNWTPLEINENNRRISELLHESELHDATYDRKKCLEYFVLSELVQVFSEDEQASAVIEANKLTEAK